jgi:aryl-alcohol dehydrogenase-like predicted oxidoreductase
MKDFNATKSELGLGCWALGDPYWKQPDQKGPGGRQNQDFALYRRILREAFSRGIRHFDTAQGYGKGISEQITGQVLRSHREELCVATKTFFRPPETIRRGIEKSLKRLQTDYIDIFYLHWPKPGRDLRPHMEELEKARRSGLIRKIGVSNFQPLQIEALLQAGQVDFCQFGYSLLWRLPEKELVPFCLRQGIRMVTYSSLAQGILAHPAGWADSLHPDDPRRRLLFFKPEARVETGKIVEALNDEAASLGLPPAVLSLAWNLSRPWAGLVLFGARSPGQVEQSAGAAHLQISPDTRDTLDEMSAGLVKVFAAEDNIFGHRP